MISYGQGHGRRTHDGASTVAVVNAERAVGAKFDLHALGLACSVGERQRHRVTGFQGLHRCESGVATANPLVTDPGDYRARRQPGARGGATAFRPDNPGAQGIRVSTELRSQPGMRGPSGGDELCGDPPAWSTGMANPRPIDPCWELLASSALLTTDFRGVDAYEVTVHVDSCATRACPG